MVDKEINWRPTVSFENLRLRARVLSQIRQFFAQRDVLEVETPLMCHATVTDPFIDSFSLNSEGVNHSAEDPLYLQTSPEYAMKRLLAVGSGAIYQICKAFRRGELGAQHNPEFTILEWYRPGFDHHDLMAEVAELLSLVLGLRPSQFDKFSYQDIFLEYLDVDPHRASCEQLQDIARRYGIDEIIGLEKVDKDTYLQLLMSDVIEPHLGLSQPAFVYDFPTSQAALARIRPGVLHDSKRQIANETSGMLHGAQAAVAERFEVYVQGVELANGFHELKDCDEQAERFSKDLAKRSSLKKELPPVDERFLAALQHGLPDCAGVAMGVDRLVMLAAKCDSLQDVMAFPVSLA